MSKTNDNQDLEGVMGYCANALKTIGKTDFEVEGVSICAHQWNTSNARKHNTAGMLHA